MNLKTDTQTHHSHLTIQTNVTYVCALDLDFQYARFALLEHRKEKVPRQ